MDTVVLRVKTESNPQLNDDEVVYQFLDKLIKDHPRIQGYIIERPDGEHINILLYGDSP